ncbi:nodulation protein NfeD [Myxococcota bacterium]|nr:nodulation protein NfeD [Myxococcota bacterium]
MAGEGDGTRRRSARARGVAALAVVLGALGSSVAAEPIPSPAPLVHSVVLDDDAIDPGTGAWIVRALAAADEAGADAFLLQLDTPGGLLGTTRDIVKAELASEVPVIVWVGPSGARAGSAGVFITVAAGLAAMAPGTHIGAAHPVSLLGAPPVPPDGGEGDPAPLPSSGTEMERKVLKDTLAWVSAICEQRGRPVEWCVKAVAESDAIPSSEALEKGVVDVIAADVTDLLRRVDGREVPTAREPAILRTAGARVVEVEPSLREQVVHLLSDPNVLFLLIAVGLLGILGELSHPGTILPGVVGLGSLIAAAVGLAIVPFNVAGLLLVGLAFVLFVLEAFVTSFGLLTVGGILSLVLGGLLLFDTPGSGVRVDVGVLAGVAVAVGVAAATIGVLVARAYRTPIRTGMEGMIGQLGTVTRAFMPAGTGFSGTLFARGEYWTGWAAAPLEAGARVRVIAMEGLQVTVEPVEEGPPTGVGGVPPPEPPAERSY